MRAGAGYPYLRGNRRTDAPSRARHLAVPREGFALQTQRGHRAKSENLHRSRHQEGTGIRPPSETANAISSKPASENQIIAYRMCWLQECERCRTSSSRSCNALDRRRQGAPRAAQLRQARWAASLHKMRRCGSGAFDVRYTLNSGAKSNVAGCPSWV